MALSEQLRSRIQSTIQQHPVVLFMKGSKHFPQCGFSAAVVRVLQQHKVPFETVNVLADPELREGIKEFSDWPTIPQLYIKGEFIGGSDIVKELDASGELANALSRAVGEAKPQGSAAPVKAPKVTITEQAARQLQEALRAEQGGVARLSIDERFQHDLFLGDADGGDVVVVQHGVELHLDADSATRAEGLTIAWEEGQQGAGFRLDNPNQPPQVRQLAPRALKAMMDGGEELLLVDVRTPAEYAIARIEGAKLLDSDVERLLSSRPKDATLVFHCHHGGRSQRAAEQWLARGYRRVYNLAGGIDAWSQTVDSKVPRY